MVGAQKIPLYMIFPSLQPDENMPTDFEEFDTEQFGWPSARELERRALRVASHEVIQIDGAFFEQNITRNLRARGGGKESGDISDGSNNTVDERIAIWVVWFYHSTQCGKTDACDKTAPGFRKLSIELQGIARFAAINCKVHSRACRGHASGATSMRVYVQRGTKHFVESFAFDSNGYGGSSDTLALAGAAQILKLLVKPAVQLWYPPHPHRSTTDAAEGVAAPGSAAEAAATAASGGTIDLTKVDPSKLKVAQLKSIIASRGERCVGCADKSDFVGKVREIALRDSGADSGAKNVQEEL